MEVLFKVRQNELDTSSERTHYPQGWKLLLCAEIGRSLGQSLPMLDPFLQGVTEYTPDLRL